MRPLCCNTCDVRFESSTKLSNHNYDVHVNSLKVSLENETLFIDRVDKKFTCPRCPSKLSTPTTLNRHLMKMHNGRCSALTKKERDPLFRLNSNNNNNNSDGADDHSEEGSAEPVNRSLPSIQIPRLDINGRDSSSSSTSNTSLSEYNKSVLTATNTINCPESEQKKSLLLCELGELNPITFKTENGEEYHFLTSQATIDRIIADQPAGVRIRRA